MSRKSDKEKLFTEVEQLFAELDESKAPELAALDETARVQGWSWAVDGDGLYTDCSPEVYEVLGMPAGAFLGQPFASFSVARDAIILMAEALQAENLPLDVTVTFYDIEGEPRQVILSVLESKGENGVTSGWRGFARLADQEIVLPSEEDTKVIEEAETVEEEVETKDEVEDHPSTDALFEDLSFEAPEPEYFVPSESSPDQTKELVLDEEADVDPEENGLELSSEEPGFTYSAVELTDREEDVTDPEEGEDQALEAETDVEASETKLEFVHQVGTGQLEPEEIDEQPAIEDSEEIETLSSKVPSFNPADATGPLVMPVENQEPVDDMNAFLDSLYEEDDGSFIEDAESALEIDELDSDIGELVEDISPTEAQDIDEIPEETIIKADIKESEKPIPSSLVTVEEDPSEISVFEESQEALLPEVTPEIQAWLDELDQDETIVSEVVAGEVLEENETVLAASMRMPDGEGLLEIIDDDPNREWTDEDRLLVAQVADQLSLALENANLFQQTQASLTLTDQQARRLAQINQMSEALSRANELEEILTITAQFVDQIVPCERGRVALLDEDDNSLHVYDLHGEEGAARRTAAMPLETTMLGEAINGNRVIAITNMDQTIYTDAQVWNTVGVNSALTTPLFGGGKVIGALSVGSREVGAYSSREENLFLSVSSILGSTIDNRRLFTQIARRSTQLQTSAEVSRSASSILDRQELFNRVVHLISDGFDLYYAGIFLVDKSGDQTGEPGQWAVLMAGSGEPGMAMVADGHKLRLGGDSMIGTAIAHAQARIAEDVTQEPAFFRNPHLPETLSEMALPLISRGEVLGALTIQSELEAAFSEDDITALQTLADQIANAIENASLFEQTQERAEELAVLNEMARAFTQTLEVDTVIQDVHRFTNRLMDASNFYLALYHPERDEVHFRLFYIEGERHYPEQPRRRAENGITEWIISNKQPLLLSEHADAWLAENNIEIRGEKADSWLGVPMLRGGQVIGVIAVQNYTTPRFFGEHQLDLLTAVANQAAIAIENARLFQQTRLRAQREQVLREITSKVHGSADADSILRTAVREVSTALGRQAYIYLGDKDGEENEGEIDTSGSPEHVPPFDRSALGPEDDTNSLKSQNNEEQDA
ncbi:MAG: GAF domain-containing protein [Chloroflexi bacterium]|nr:MAG: GAF domain-containing protein [Chloroflexota bacterium]MBL1194095.1 GAF domain-containing protein [Chloroflexota bacterium]NOH11389.1 GAF domain-containing protein [Chloroflexota bacterium]